MTMRAFIDIIRTAETQRLDEMWWGERYAAAKAIQRHPGCFVHFSNINKLGVNPSKTHRDPPGVYFYPGQWLFSDDSSLSQFATEYQYYFLVSLKMDRDFINLGTLTAARIKQIATANGWAEDLQRFMADPSILKDTSTAQHNPKLLKKAGGFFYAAMDHLVNVEKKYRWLQMLRGVTGLYDPKFGIIAAGEAAQAVVFDASAIKILEMGDNKDEMSRTLADAFRPVAEKMGGKFFYRNKIPTISIQQGGKSVEVAYEWFNYRWVARYSKDGFITVDTNKEYNTNTGDADSIARSMIHYLTDALKKADDQPVKSGPWDGARLMEVRNLIGTLRARLHQGVRNGTYRVVANEYSSYGWSRSLSLETDDAQTIRVKASIERSGSGEDEGYEIVFEKTYDGRTSPEQVAHAALSHLWAGLKPHLPETTSVQQAEDILGINFTKVAQQ